MVSRLEVNLGSSLLSEEQGTYKFALTYIRKEERGLVVNFDNLPILRECFCHCQGGKQVATGAARGDQEPGHGGGRSCAWRLT